MKIKFLFLLVISGILIAADQAIKIYVHTHFMLGESTTVIPNLFQITYVRNPGAAFGFLATTPPAFREIFFLSMPPFALLIILLILRGVQEADRITISALSMIFGGAIGNYIDRLHLGYVIDFLDFTVRFKKDSGIEERWSWPAFNIADMGIVCGVALLLMVEQFKLRKKVPAPAKAQTT